VRLGSSTAPRDSAAYGKHATTEKGLRRFESTRIILSALLLSGIRPGQYTTAIPFGKSYLYGFIVTVFDALGGKVHAWRNFSRLIGAA